MTRLRRVAARYLAVMPVRKVVVMASASGNGKTTLGRELARRLGVPFVEMDALVHGPGWVDTPDDELRAQVEPIVASDGWVIDGPYRGKLGDLVLDGSRRRSSGSTCRCGSGCRGSSAAPPGGFARARSSGTGTRRRSRTCSGAATRCSSVRCVHTSAVAGSIPRRWRSGTWLGCEHRPRSSASSRDVA